MKIPSLFGRTPKHQQFAYKPRYYDPRKEEMREREARIRKELEEERGATGDDSAIDVIDTGHRARMKGSFQAARKRSKNADGNVVLIRLGALLFVSLLLVGFFQWGKAAFYSLFLVFPLWIWLRFFRRN